MADTEHTRADERGLPLTAASDEARDAFDHVMHGYLEYRLDTGQRLKQALSLDPAMPLALAMRGYLFMLFGMRSFVPRAAAALGAAREVEATATARERAHIAALAAWVEGDWQLACERWASILHEHPHDLLALRLHHYLSFWMGRGAGMRNTVAGVLDAWDGDVPGYGSVLGMWSFGLEECGAYGQAEEAGRLAVELNPDDLWAIHAVAHVLEMQGRLDDGIAWLDRPADAWDDRNPFRGHLWWHLALFPLEQGDYDRVLALYDERVTPASTDFYLDVQNMASLLARLELQGVDVGDRWQPVCEFARAATHDHALPFTDTHLALALGMGGEPDAAAEVAGSLRVAMHDADHGIGPWAGDIAVTLTAPLCEAAASFAAGDHARALSGFGALRDRAEAIGGSHAQRDLFHQLMAHAASRAGQAATAVALWRERATLKPQSAGNWQHLAAALEANGQPDEARRARRRGPEPIPG